MGFEEKEEEEEEKGESIYEKHLEMEEMKEGLMKGELVKGKWRVGEDWRQGKVGLWL